MLKQSYQELYEQWQTDPCFDLATQQELQQLTDEREIEDRFYRELQFGTAGMRGLMGAGTNRLNKYIVRKATQALADCLLQVDAPGTVKHGVVLAYDSRHNSADFALQAALTLGANGITAYLFAQPMPVPVLSFAVRHLQCLAGIVITASHNPKEYNGYKVYNRYGYQITPQEAGQIINNFAAVSLEDVCVLPEKEARTRGLLKEIGPQVLDDFIAAVSLQTHYLQRAAQDDLQIVYTPLHGSGNIPVRLALARLGYKNVQVVAAQEAPDGNFPTVRTPNPEEQDALALGIELARESAADLVLGTDPDCDRIGVAVREGAAVHQDKQLTGNQQYQLLTGNQIGAILVNYIILRRGAQLPDDAVIIKTIVTSELGAAVARAHGLSVVNTLTGFKYIGEKMHNYEQDHSASFVMGYEESYGYLIGSHCRDKDAVVAAVLLSEMTAWYKAQGKTLLDVLAELYERYGYFLDAQDSFSFQGKEGAQKMADLMVYLRQLGRGLLADIAQIKDYKLGIEGLPEADVLKYILTNGSWLAVRPSGTEPKIKIYYSVKQTTAAAAAVDLKKYRQAMRDIIDSVH